MGVLAEEFLNRCDGDYDKAYGHVKDLLKDPAS